MGSGEKGNLPMAELHKMLNRGADAGGVVEENRAGLGIIEVKLGEHDGDVVVGEILKDRFLLAEGKDGNALDLALDHAAHAVGEHCRIAVG